MRLHQGVEKKTFSQSIGFKPKVIDGDKPRFNIGHQDGDEGFFMWIVENDDFEAMLLDQVLKDNTVKRSYNDFKETERIAEIINKRLNKNG